MVETRTTAKNNAVANARTRTSKANAVAAPLSPVKKPRKVTTGLKAVVQAKRKRELVAPARESSYESSQHIRP